MWSVGRATAARDARFGRVQTVTGTDGGHVQLDVADCDIK
jgi:hypothetical protein